MKWIMIAAGLLTCSMIKAVLLPSATVSALFGETLEGPVAELVIRNWGVLIFLMGLLLIYGAFRPALRTPILLAGGASKLMFIVFVLSAGLMGGQARIAVIIDVFLVGLFAVYLIMAQRRRTPSVESR
jgi:hypothetical protein